MRVRLMGCVVAVLAVAMTSQTASACHMCKQNPCVLVAPQPAYQCVTEMVPYTVMKNHWRTEYETVTQDGDGATADHQLRRAAAGGVQAGLRHDRSSPSAGGVQADPRDRLCHPDLHGLQARPDDPAGDQLLHAADDPACHGAHRSQVRSLPQGSVRLQDGCPDHLYPRAGGQGRGHDHDGSRNSDPPGADSSHPVCPGSRE